MADTINFGVTVLGRHSIASKSPRREKEGLTSPLGLFTIHEPSSPTVDIVFVHGLHGHATKTWANSRMCWPETLLRNDVEHARIMTFGYTDLISDEIPLRISDIAKALLASLSIDRRVARATIRPLVFIAHSLGGIVVKSVFLHSRALKFVDNDSFSVSEATVACVFFGTPHLKTRTASWAQMKWQISRLLAAEGLALKNPSAIVLDPAEAENMLRLSSDFSLHSGQMRLLSFYETLMKTTNLGKPVMVPQENAVMNTPNELRVPLDAGHEGMTIIKDSTSKAYKLILEVIRDNPEFHLKIMAQKATPGLDQESAINIDGECTSCGEVIGLAEQERCFLADLKSDWLDDVMIENNYPETCEWVLQSPELQSWLQGSETMLCIIGKPGVGKTVLAKYVYRQLHEKFASESRQVAAYFLDGRSRERNNAASVIRCLLHQILSTNPEMFKYIHGRSSFPRPQGGGFRQHTKILSAVLRDASLSETIIVLDALDECEVASRSLLINTLLAMAKDSRIKVLVTSRPDSRIKPPLKIDLDGCKVQIDHDIKLYVESAVTRLARERGLVENWQDWISLSVLGSAPGSFLWVWLTLQSILLARTVRDLRIRLCSLTPFLHDSYSDFLGRSLGFIDVSTRRTLYFVMAAEVPLQVEELSALLALSQCWNRPSSELEKLDLNEPGISNIAINSNLKDISENQTINFEQDLMPHFRPLLSTKEGSISLVHTSLREFLVRPDEISQFLATFNLPRCKNEDYTSALPDVHAITALLLLQYLLAAFREKRDPLGFQHFACTYWTEHARKAGETHKEILYASIKALFSDSADFSSSWLQFVANTKDLRPTLVPHKADVAFILAAFDLCSLYGEKFGVSMRSLESTDNEERIPLHFAAANNAISSIRWIQTTYSAEGKNPEKQSTRKDKYSQSPIHLAAQHGHQKAVELLLTSTNLKFALSESTFDAIANRGHHALFETLYNHSDVQAPDQGLALLPQVVQLDNVGLLKKIHRENILPNETQGASVATLTISGDPLLHLAIKSQSPKTIDFLLDNKNSVGAVDRSGCTALHIAAEKGNEPIARKLIDAGILINAANGEGETALHIACGIGLPGIVRLLCENGANVNLPNSAGRFPVHLAAAIGQIEAFEILSNYGATMVTTDLDGCNALHIAARAGQSAMVSNLLQKGAFVDAMDRRARTPVHYAAQNGELDLFNILCNAGARFDSIDIEEVQPLHLAAEQGSAVFVRHLLLLGAWPDCRDSADKTPLHYSCLSKRPTYAAIQELLFYRADVNRSDDETRSPLDYARQNGKVSVVKLLLECGAID